MASPGVQTPQQWQLVQGMSNLTLQSPQLQQPPLQQSQPPLQQQQWQVVSQAPMQQQWQVLQQSAPQMQVPSGFPQPFSSPSLPAFSAAAAGFGGVAGNSAPQRGGGGTAGSVQRIRVGEAKDERLGALIVTITEGSSYDPIFQQVEQTDDQGTCVATYRVSLTGLQDLVTRLESASSGSSGPRAARNDDMEELLRNLEEVPRDKVVFNWECCSCCSEGGFCSGGGFFGGPLNATGTGAGGSEASLRLAKVALDRGYMVMFSDFSLKALISHWKTEYFGPKPFQQTGVCSGQMRLNFDPEVLKNCSSKQLAKVGELCEEGQAVIHAASNTIVYQLLANRAQEAERSQAYKVEVLTSVSLLRSGAPPGYGAAYGGINTLGFPQAPSERKSMGHVLLTYPSGGRMLTSAGHWKELVHLGGVSEDALLRVAERYYGKEFSTNLGQQLQQCPDMGSRMQMHQQYAQQCVQSSAPY